VRVAVVGGGIVGLSCAFALRRAGAEVTVYERGRVGQGCSRGNTGWICPGLSAPLPAPGVMGGALRGMLHRDSPLQISPLLGPSFLRWSWGFWRASSRERYRSGLEATVALTKSAFRDYDALAEAGVEFVMHTDGLLFVAMSREARDAELQLLRQQRAVGYRGRFEALDGAAVREREPGVEPRARVVGGEHGGALERRAPVALRRLRLEVVVLPRAEVEPEDDRLHRRRVRVVGQEGELGDAELRRGARGDGGGANSCLASSSGRSSPMNGGCPVSISNRIAPSA